MLIQKQVFIIIDFKFILSVLHNHFTCFLVNLQFTTKANYTMIYRFFLLIFFALCSLRSVGQPYCDVRTFTIRDGLSANIISAFMQTPDGLMWFSTWNGLCYYDGYRFTTFRNSIEGGMVLSTNRIMQIQQSAIGGIWCSTSDLNVYYFDTRRSRFIDVSSMIRKRFNHNLKVRSIYSLGNGYTWLACDGNTDNYRVCDSSLINGDAIIERYSQRRGNMLGAQLKKVELDSFGREWIFSDRGVNLADGSFRFSAKMEYMYTVGGVLLMASTDGRLFRYDADKKVMSPLKLPDVVSRINAAEKYGKNKLLLATNAGIVMYNAVRQSVSMLSVQTPAQPSPEVTSVFVDRKSRIWAFTKSSGIVLLSGKSLSPRWLMADADTPLHRTSSLLPFVHEDSYGTVWTVPTDGTFSYYDEQAGQLVPYMLSSGRRMDMYFPEVKKFMFDKEGNMWFTGSRDVNLVNFRYHNFKFTRVFPGQEVRSLLCDRRGQTWAGTANGLLAIFDSQRKLRGYVDRQGHITSSPVKFSDRIYSLFEDSHGRIWVGTKGYGLYVISGEGKVQHFVNSQNDRFSLSFNEVYDIDTDSKGRIWVATYSGGPNMIDETGGGIRFINYRNMLSQYPIRDFGRVRRIAHTPKGELLLSTTNGIVTFSDRFNTASDIHFHTTSKIMGDTTSLLATDVLQTLVMRSSRVVVLTMGGGLQLVGSDNLLTDNLKFCDLPNAKPDEGMVQSATEDSNGNLLIMREGSIDRYNFSTGELLQYGPGNIGDGVELSEAEPANNEKSGFTYVAARGGFVSFNSSELTKSNYRPNIVFTRVNYHSTNRIESILGNDVLDVPADSRNLTIYFAALEYSDKYLVRYAYKLEGVDDNWTFVGPTNSASFNKLPAGHYKLLVKSTNADGVWVDNVTELAIYAHPTFWETPWAWLLYVLLVGLVIYVAIYVYKLRAKAVLERDLNDMKTKFFTEIGHKLRTPLTLIGGPVSEVLKGGGLSDVSRRHLEMVQRNATRMLDLVNKMLRYNIHNHVYISDDNAHEHLVADNDKTPSQNPAVAGQEGSLKILVVEDNNDLRAFLVSILCSDYIVCQAENGQKGLEIAEKQMPDFIITDVMMPVMDGLTMVHKIKQNKDICHIPIIVLSAKASLDDRLQGLREGIDDYITKPFSATYLKMRVQNIISQRRMLQQNYVTQLDNDKEEAYKLEAPQIVDADKDMMKRLMDYLEENIGNPELKIEDLASAVSLGRSVFYGKIKSIVGMTPVDFVRHIRILRAEEMITKSNYSFSQIAYAIGFSDPKYFSKCFKKETGMTPSEYRDKAERGSGEK